MQSNMIYFHGQDQNDQGPEASPQEATTLALDKHGECKLNVFDDFLFC